MFKLYYILVLSLILFCTSAALAKIGQKGFVKAVMHTFYSELAELKTVVASDEEFKKPENKEKIQSALTRLNKKLNSRKPKRLDSWFFCDL
ncbi:MAG: hypothetical protein HRT45_15145 [Bdellovibrionales bacterium]|nr:hypothetical protein [Bdellovibrionales bacterium]